MLTRLFSRLKVHQVPQTRNGSGFNKSPVLKVPFCGLSGNAWLFVGFTSLVVTVFLAQKGGALIPPTPGWGGIFKPKIPGMDLTPDELKNKDE